MSAEVLLSPDLLCVCAWLPTEQLPCVRCARKKDALTPSVEDAPPPAVVFPMVSATLWRVTVTFAVGATPRQVTQFLMLTAAPDGSEVHSLACALVRRRNPGANDLHVTNAEHLAEVFGTVARGQGAS